MKRAKIWVVIPGYNESEYLQSVLSKVTEKTDNIIYVDDGSQDNSITIAKDYLDHVLKHPINLGKGAAMKTGCEYAFNQLEAEAVVFMDADDQHNPDDLEKFYQIFTAEADDTQLIFGERKLDSRMPLVRIIGNRIASYLVLVMFGRYVPDIPSGFKALTKKAYEQVEWKTSDYGVELELAVRVAKQNLNFKTVTIETIYHDLDRGMTFLDTIKMVLQIISWKLTL